MILSVFTLFHVVLSLVGIGSGFVVVYGLLASKRFEGWTKLFLTTTVATSVTGFLFPFHQFLPSQSRYSVTDRLGAGDRSTLPFSS